MKKQYILLSFAAITAIGFTSCDDFLDRKPLSSVTDVHYLNSESELASFGAYEYQTLPSHPVKTYSLGTFGTDNNSDNQCSSTANSNFLPGERRVSSSNGAWDFQLIRNCNYFLETVLPKYEAGAISGGETNIRHYIGEMYFFRATHYFDYLKQYGDFPIVERVLSDNYTELAEANQRRPRNEVARFILADLDKAIEMMRETPPQSNRLTRYAALLFKSRVALYEGTWLKYHAGTDRVPGGPGWPGANASYLSGFTIDLNSEINFFLNEACKSAEQVADKFKLGDYASMFNSLDLSSMEEVLLWRRYNSTDIFHYVTQYLQTVYPGGNGCGETGFSRALVETYLMKNGLPIYATGSGYEGDVTLAQVVANRDERLRESVSIPGDVINPLITFTRPGITIPEANRNTTGYCLRKGLNQDPAMAATKPSYTASVVYRAGEAYLNYMEAQYLRDGALDAKSTSYWTALRERAGVDTDIQKTINATDLNKENDLAVYSGTTLVDITLYNIRRERRSELIAEGHRLDDLYRWRALDLMKDYHIEGFNLWDEQYKLYPEDGILKPDGDFTDPNVSSRDYKYLRPFRVHSNNKAYNGYTFMQAHYLAPIGYDAIRLSTPELGGDISTAYIYQNPGWSIEPGSGAEK